MTIDLSDLAPQSVDVRLHDGRNAILREATEDAVRIWRNAMMRATKPGPDGRPSTLGDLADTRSLLVAHCMEVDGKVPSVAEVRGWPARVVERLHDWVMEASGLAAKAEAPAPDPTAASASGSPANSGCTSMNSSDGRAR